MRPNDDIGRMVTESQALVKTYLEGAGIIAWRDADRRYKAVDIPMAERVSTVDNILYRIASEIKSFAPAGKAPPPPEVPPERAVDLGALEQEAPSA